MVVLPPTARVAGPTSLSATYLLLLAGSGAYVPFLTLHLLELGWTAAAVGGLLTAVAVVRLVAAPGAGLLADRLRRDDVLFSVMTALAAVGVAVVATAHAAALVAVAALTVAAVRAPASIVLDTAIVRTLGERGLPVSHYGRVRLWGSVGYLLSALVVGWRFGATPALAIAASSVCLVAAAASGASLGAGRGRAPARLGPALRGLARDRVLGTLMVAGALHGASINAFDAWFPALLAARGWLVAWTGAAMVLGIGAEIVALRLAPQLRERVEPGALLVAAGVLGGVRLLASAWAPTLALVLAAQVLHGVALGLWWAAIVEATARRATPEVRASTQALLVASAYGVGPALTSALSTVLVVGTDPRPLFVAAAGLAFAGAWVAQRAERPLLQPA